MSEKNYNEAPVEDRHHFFSCAACGEKIDSRDLSEVFEHERHVDGKPVPLPEAHYTGSLKMTGNMVQVDTEPSMSFSGSGEPDPLVVGVDEGTARRGKTRNPAWRCRLSYNLTTEQRALWDKAKEKMEDITGEDFDDMEFFIALVVDYVERDHSELARLRQWKSEMTAVEDEWKPEEVSKLLGLPLGKSIRAGIEPAIRELIRERDEARSYAEVFREYLLSYHRDKVLPLYLPWDTTAEKEEATTRGNGLNTPLSDDDLITAAREVDLHHSVLLESRMALEAKNAGVNLDNYHTWSDVAEAIIATRSPKRDTPADTTTTDGMA